VALTVATLLAAMACSLGFGVGSASASTEGESAESIFGFLRDPRGKELTPVQGAKVTVKGKGGFSETATSDENGRWTVDVPAPGSYEVSLDEKSLGKANLREGARNPITVPVAQSQDKPVLFALGKSTRQVESKWSQAAQLTAEGFRFGLILALAAVGLSLIFGTTGLTNFAHGELVTIGGLAAWYFNNRMGLDFFVSVVLALVVGAVIGLLNDSVLWKPLRRRGTGLIAAMVVSIGLSILLRYFYLYLAGGTNKSYADFRGAKGLGLGPVTLATKDYLSIALAIVVLVAVGIALLKTKIGKATRAVADNPALASASGIDVDRVIRVVWISGSTLAALSGILLGLAQGVNFQMGFQILLLIFAAVTLGGLGTAFGALVGSIVVGLFISVSTLWIPTELKNVGALGILIVILLVRPQGLLGRSQRVG
jgi:branched-chain amino acid transport system permease protein